MRNMVWTWVALVFLLLTCSPADAFCCPSLMCYCPPAPCCMAYETRVVTCYRPEWKEEKVPIVVRKVNYRQETSKVNVTVLVPKMFDQVVRTSYCVPIPKVVSYDVTNCVMVPVVLFDPCSCCCYMSCAPQWITRKVQRTIYEPQVQTRDDVVKVCKMVPEVRIVDQTRVVPVVTQENSFCIRRYCVMVPYQTTVNVPVYVPCCQ